jgi:hypothetical protein
MGAVLIGFYRGYLLIIDPNYNYSLIFIEGGVYYISIVRLHTIVMFT